MIPNVRTKYHVSPIFGNMHFSVGDLSTSYTSPVKVVPKTNVDYASTPFVHGGNSVEILASFTDTTTSCSIAVLGADGVTVIKNFDNITGLNADGLYVGGQADAFLLAGDPVSINVSNVVGTGFVTVYCRKVA